MPANRPRSLQIYDPVLTNLARSYRTHGFIADQLLAKIPTAKLSAQYPIFDKAFWFRNVDNRSTDRTPSKEIDFEWSLDTFLCEEYSLKSSITDLERDQADPSLYLERSKTELLTASMDLAHEVRVAQFFDIVSAGGGLNNSRTSTPSVNWDQDTATVEANIKTGVLDVYDSIGHIPNVCVIPYKVAYAMALQEDIRAILRNDATGQGVPFLTLGSRILPATIHGMKVIIPMGAQIDASNEGGAESISEIWGDDVRLLKVETGAKWGQPSAGYQIVHTARRVTKWRTVDPDINYIREMERYDLKMVAPDAGHIIKDVLS